jgi:Subtilase family
MAEHPLLFFPKAVDEASSLRHGRGGSLKTPSAAEQQARLDNRFRQITQSFQDLQASVQGMEPEQVIVLETIGDSTEEFAKAAAQVPGLEWLAEMDLEDTNPADGFRDAKKEGKKLPCRLYAVMSNQQAITQLIALWSNWCANPDKRAKPSFGPFKDVFVHLKDIRRWDVKDRLAETRVVEYWEQNLLHERGNIRFEVELWCRGDEAKRRKAYENLSQHVASAGGLCVSQAAIPPILYFGVLVELPAARVRETIATILDASYSQLLRCEDVMFFRPFGQSVFPGYAIEDEDAPQREVSTARGLTEREPVVAFLDGLPLEHHDLLEGRLQIDDEDDFANLYRAGQQQHGTAMASLIAHGDLGASGKPLSRPVYVRPILIPSEGMSKTVYEKTPDDRLLVDVIHRAVRRIKGSADEPGAAPNVKVINLSIGNSWQPFDRQLSPLARLLDWLAWEYQILFIVSLGNQAQRIELAFDTLDISAATAEEMISKTLEAIRNDQVHRRPFSPAEALNVLTVGAIHADACAWNGADRRVDLLKGARVPSPLGTVASGFNRAVKPDLLFPGGRQLYLQEYRDQPPPNFSIAASPQAPGIRVAAPGVRPMELNRTVYSRGSSNATALATRTSGLIHERLMSLTTELGGDRITADYLPVMLKALLVHGASWGEAGDILDRVFGGTDSDWRKHLRLKSRFLGYGEVDPNRALFSTDQRVVMLGWDSLVCDHAHVYRVPLPPSLSGRKVKRRLAVSLAWISPINPRHKNYRKAALWFSQEKEALGLAKTDLDFDSSKRGTLQHQIFEGDKARAFVDGDAIGVKVNCAEDAGKLTEKIPYAIAVTLEIAEPVDIRIFEEVRDRIRQKIEIAP